jgi:hypothetical protein
MTHGPSVCHNHSMQQLLPTLLLLSATVWPASLVAGCLRYGDVRLSGRLVQQTYPGAPDFESVTRGDEPLVIWILQLDPGVCVVSGASSYSSAYYEREIQLVLGSDPYARAAEYAQYRHLLGQKIAVTGRLLPGGGKYEKRFVIAPHAIDRGEP